METQKEESVRKLATMMFELELVFNNFHTFRIKPARLVVTRQVCDAIGEEQTQGFTVHVRNKLKQQASELLRLQTKVTNYEDLFKKYDELNDKRKRNNNLTKKLASTVRAMMERVTEKNMQVRESLKNQLPGRPKLLMKMSKTISEDKNMTHFSKYDVNVDNE